MKEATINEFRQAMRKAGIEPPAEIVLDGMLHRFHVHGDRRGDHNGWYILHTDTPIAGAFGCWKRGIQQTWSSANLTILSPSARQEVIDRVSATLTCTAEERERQRATCKQKAARFWNSSRPATPAHPYLRAKGIAPHCLRIYRQDQLLVPVLDGRELVGLQFIDAYGRKRFLAGTSVTGNYATIGKPSDGVIYICEGYATGATIYEATSGAVAVAFNARNLEAVAQRLKEAFPNKTIVICADDDRETPGNPGLTNATEAAQAIGGLLAVPDFVNLNGNPTDFNDLHQREGIEAVRRCLERGRRV